MNNKKTTLILLAAGVYIWAVNVIVDIVLTARKHRFIKLWLDSTFLTACITAFVTKLIKYQKDGT